MKKYMRIAALALAVITALLLVSCGDGSADGVSSDVSETVQVISDVGAVSLPTVDASGLFSDVSIPDVSIPDVIEPTELISLGAQWSCLTLDTDDFKTYIAEHPEWKDPGYDVSNWQTANAPLGDRLGSTPIGWGSESEPRGLLAVTTFEIEDIEALADSFYSMYVFYDNTFYMYLNGNLIYSDDMSVSGLDRDWLDEYQTKEFAEDIGRYLVEGVNTVAVSLLDGWGGRELDLSLSAK